MNSLTHALRMPALTIASLAVIVGCASLPPSAPACPKAATPPPPELLQEVPNLTPLLDQLMQPYEMDSPNKAPG